MCEANCTLLNLLLKSMKLTDVHTNRHLTLTVLQLAFSLHSVSVSYLCYFHNHHYDCSHCGPLKLNQSNTNCMLPHATPTHRLHHPLISGQVEPYFGKCLVAPQAAFSALL